MGTGSGERGTEVWKRVVSCNVHKSPKWPMGIKNPIRSMIENVETTLNLAILL